MLRRANHGVLGAEAATYMSLGLSEAEVALRYPFTSRSNASSKLLRLVLSAASSGTIDHSRVSPEQQSLALEAVVLGSVQINGRTGSSALQTRMGLLITPCRHALGNFTAF